MKKFFLAVIAACVTTVAFAQTPLVINDTGHGTQFGTKPTQALSFYGSNPIIQPQLGSSSELIAILKNFGLFGGNGAIDLNLSGGALNVGSLTISGTVTGNIARSGTTTGGTMSSVTLIIPVISGTASTTPNSLCIISGTLNFIDSNTVAHPLY